MATCTTKTTNAGWHTASLSPYHGGQIHQPTVEFRRSNHYYEVRWHWTDRSVPRGEADHRYGDGTASGSYQAVSRAIADAGIRVDDHRL